MNNHKSYSNRLVSFGISLVIIGTSTLLVNEMIVTLHSFVYYFGGLLIIIGMIVAVSTVSSAVGQRKLIHTE